MNNPINNKNLNDLLKKATPINIGAESLDDFEKDALQGFGTLESSEEAMELKAQLDKKIYAEVFTKKKSEVKVYWYAAAGLFLVVGFSVFFLLTNTNPDTNSKLALVQKEEKAENELQPNPLQTPEQVSELDKKQITAADAVPPVETKGKTKSAGDKAEENVAFGAAKGPGNPGEGNIVTTTAAEKAADSETQNNNQQDLAQNESAAGKDNRANKADKSAGDDYKRLEGEREDAKKLRDNLSDRKTQPVTKEEVDELKAEQKKETALSRKKEKSKSPAKSKNLSESDNDESKNGLAGGVANNNTNNNEVNIPATEEKPDDSFKKSVGKSANSTPASAAQPKANIGAGAVNCYYTGGNDALKKEISEKLNAMRINKKFEAVLFINTKSEIEKVSFTKLFDLTKDDETHIAESLKSLNKFKFINTPEKGLFEYKVIYNP